MDIVDSGAVYKLVTVVNILCLYNWTVVTVCIKWQYSVNKRKQKHVHSKSRYLFSSYRASYIIPSQQHWQVLRAAVNRPGSYDSSTMPGYITATANINRYFNKYLQVQFHVGVPELSSEAFYNGEPTLIIVNDVMSETNQLVSNIVTKISHNNAISNTKCVRQ